MNTTYLVAGATGRLGRPTLDELRRRGLDARGLSRSAAPGRVAADLYTGAGLTEALTGVDVVIHAASAGGRRDVRMAEKLVWAARTAGVRHLVLVSIVGVDRIPLGFYRDRLRIEEIVRRSGVPFTLQRVTQFHSFVDGIFSAQRRLPLILAPAVRFQPIAVEDVAVRLADLATAEPAGRVGDVGGPEARDVRDLGEAWRLVTGARGRLLSLRLPGRLFAALARGENLVTGDRYGRRTFDEYLAATYSGRR